MRRTISEIGQAHGSAQVLAEAASWRDEQIAPVNHRPSRTRIGNRGTLHEFVLIECPRRDEALRALLLNSLLNAGIEVINHYRQFASEVVKERFAITF